jgi:hypothetical protein
MDPMNQNIYGYTNGNPVSYFDLDGHFIPGDSSGERAVCNPNGNTCAITGSY